MKKKVAEQAETRGREWGDWDTKLRKQPNSNYFPICPLHSSVGTMHLWSIVTKAQQDSNWFVTMCRKGVFLAISPRWLVTMKRFVTILKDWTFFSVIFKQTGDIS